MMSKLSYYVCGLFFYFLTMVYSGGVLSNENTDQLKIVLQQIEQLENNSDPKCYATASRLEDFMFGTPLSDQARFKKHDLQQQWLISQWLAASELARRQGLAEVSLVQLKPIITRIFTYRQNDKGHWTLTFQSGNSMSIHKDDKRQYSSIAYSLRTLLAVQQQSLLELNDQKLPLSKEGTDWLIEALDLYSLAVLKITDQQARNQSQFEIDAQSLSAVWQDLQQNKDTVKPAQPTNLADNPASKADLSLLKATIDQKVRSFAQYNQISNSLFVRNLQVFFARNRWPEDAAEAKAFRQTFTEAVIAFAGDFYQGAQQVAVAKGHRLITEADVSEFAQVFIPHQINAYEDAIFFPRLPRDQQVTIEAYDMDAFRDSGIHWRYLQFAVDEPTFNAVVAPDPFATELLVENVAQYGVLLLRITGEIGHQAGQKRIALDHIEQAIKQIQTRAKQHGQVKMAVTSDPKLNSAPNVTTKVEGTLFSDVTVASGIDFMHRSSDWLNRLLRSYLKTGESTGTITIPPAFGGAGIAAGDIDNDGLDDLLILSGLGNRLYLNQGNGKFVDISKSAAIAWTRVDNLPGEPRQPLIADLDNDGWQDIVITYVNDSHRVYKNLGNGTFADMTGISRLGGENLVGGPATVFDFDNDGLLDIYIEYFGDYLHGVLPTLQRRNNNGLPNKLFRNVGGFKFEDVTAGSGLDHTGWGQAVTHTDFDGDGLQDLIVGNDFGVNAYFKNLGKGKFQDVSVALGIDKPSYTMGIGTTDLNGDQLPDIYVSNIVTMNKDQKYVLPEESTPMVFNPKKLATMRVIEANDLFLSGRGRDNKVSYQPSKLVDRGYSSTGWSWDADFFDFDNDGDEDLYVLNGINEFNLYSNDNPYYTDPLQNKQANVYIPVASKESNVFFANQGGRLVNVSEQSGANLVGNSRSAVYLDLDNDGDLDMVLNNYHEQAVVYRNNSEKLANHWLKVKLIGSPAAGVNLDAIGSQIIVTTVAKADEQNKAQSTIWRQVQGSTGYMSVHPKVQYFGLGQQSQATIKVKWPNGQQSESKVVDANQLIVIDYDETKLVKIH